MELNTLTDWITAGAILYTMFGAVIFLEMQGDKDQNQLQGREWKGNLLYAASWPLILPLMILLLIVAVIGMTYEAIRDQIKATQNA